MPATFLAMTAGNPSTVKIKGSPNLEVFVQFDE